MGSFDGGLDILTTLKKLTKLYLLGGVERVDLPKFIQSLTNLTNLSLPCGPPEIFSNLPKLQKLTLAGASNQHLKTINPANMRKIWPKFDFSMGEAPDLNLLLPFTNLTNLQLTIRRPPINSEAIGFLTNLENLSLNFVPLFPQQLLITKLRKLSLAGTRPDPSVFLLHVFDQLTNLEDLTLFSSVAVQPDETQNFSRLTKLTTLTVDENNFSVETLNALSNLTNLTQLYLHPDLGNPDSGRFVGIFKNFTMIKSLEMPNLGGIGDDWSYLKVLSLEKLKIWKYSDDDKVGFQYISHMKNLTDLDSYGILVKDLEHLRRMTQIKSLSFHFMDETDQQMEQILHDSIDKIES